MQNSSGIGRRAFMRTGAAVVSAGLALGKTTAAADAAGQYTSKWYPFDEHPDSDTCWSLSVGPDGRIYAAACAEGVPGGVVKPVRYNEKKDGLDYLFNLAEKVDDPGDSGRATQCKIHYSFAPSMHDGVLYMATHLSGPPIDLPVYNPWHSWHDKKRLFRGAALLAWDTRKDEVLWWDTLIPKEGCRCLLHDEERGLLYALSYPRDHFIIYDLKKRTRRDVGRIGSINGQALVLDKKHRVWTANDYGELVRYSPDTDRLEVSPVKVAKAPYQSSWHGVFYDVAPSPDRECIYASTWCPNPSLMRVWLNEKDWPRVEDLGAATQPRDQSLPGGYVLRSLRRPGIWRRRPVVLCGLAVARSGLQSHAGRAQGARGRGVEDGPAHAAAHRGGAPRTPERFCAVRFPRRRGSQRRPVLRPRRIQAVRDLQGFGAGEPQAEGRTSAVADVGVRENGHADDN